MSHFNFKSLAFYGIAIAVVIVLFEVVTSYGEKNLHAPVAIDGRYPLSFAQEPACLKSNPLVLAIQQSGTYLNASLLPTITNNGKPVSAAQKKLSLAGQLTNQQVSIAGVTKTKICGSGVPPEQVKIQGQVEIQGREGKNLKGKMTLSAVPGVPGEIDFTAKRQPPVKEEK